MALLPITKSPSVIETFEEIIRQIDEECSPKLQSGLCCPCCQLPLILIPQPKATPLKETSKSEPYCCDPCCKSSDAHKASAQPEGQLKKDDSDPHNRHDNFYNNYNIDWRHQGTKESEATTCKTNPNKQLGVTVDGKSPCCDLPSEQKPSSCPHGVSLIKTPGCVKLIAPPCNEQINPWGLKVKIQKCPPVEYET